VGEIRKDQGGGNNDLKARFLGLENIGAFNRFQNPCTTGGTLRQADGTLGWHSTV